MAKKKIKNRLENLAQKKMEAFDRATAPESDFDEAELREDLQTLSRKVRKNSESPEKMRVINDKIEQGDFRESLGLLKTEIHETLPPDVRAKLEKQASHIETKYGMSGGTLDALDTFNDAEKLKGLTSRLESSKGFWEKFQPVLEFFGLADEEIDGVSPISALLAKAEQYFVYEENEKGKAQYRMLSMKEVLAEKSGGDKWFALKHPLQMVKISAEYATMKAKKKDLLRILMIRREVGRRVDQGEALAEKGTELVDEYGDDVVATKEVGQTVVDRGKEHRAQKRSLATKTGSEVSKGTVEVASREYREQMQQKLNKVPQLGPERFHQETANLFQKNQDLIQKGGSEVQEAVLKGKFPGYELKDASGKTLTNIRSVGRGTVVVLAVRQLRKAIENKSFGPLTSQLTTSSFASEAAELLPIYGSIASAKRLNDESTGLPKWARVGEFGINMAFDAWTVGAIALTGGIGTPVALAARAGAGTMSKGLFKGLGKYLTKKGAKLAAKEIMESGAKKGLKESVEMGVKVAAKEGGEELAEGVAKKASKEIAEEGLEKVAKKKLKETVGQMWKRELGFAAGLEGGVAVASYVAGKTWDYYYPNQTVSEVAVDTGKQQALNYVGKNYGLDQSQVSFLEKVGMGDRVPDELRKLEKKAA